MTRPLRFATGSPDGTMANFTSDVLRQTLLDVEHDEAEAISLLVNLLERVRKTSHTAPLERICEVVSEWQNQPPRGMVTSFLKIAEEFEAECPTHAKR